jgi:predicted permease
MPTWCTALLTRVVTRPLTLDSIIGDLEHEANRIAATRGHRRGALWLRREALTIAARYAWARLTRSLSRHPGSPTHHLPPDRYAFMRNLVQDVVYGVRALRATPGTSAAVLFILTLGIGSLVATFSLVEAALLNPLPYPGHNRLVWAATTFDGRANPAGSAQDFADYRDRSTTFEDLGAITPFYLRVTVVAGQEPARARAAYATWNLFRVLGVNPSLGRWFVEEESQRGAAVAMVSHQFWRDQLGAATDAIGNPIRIDGAAHTLVGVMPPEFHFLLDVDVWRPMQLGDAMAGARRFHNWLMIGRLADDVSLRQAQSDMDTISAALQREYPESNEAKALALTPLAEALAGSVAAQLMLMLSAAGLVLAVAGSNVASLLLARGSTRQGELAVRAALGATRARIIRQLVVESLVLGVLAGIGGLVVTTWVRGLMLRVIPLSVLGIDDLRTSTAAMVFGIGATLAVSLLFGTLPALRVIPDRPPEALRGTRTSLGAGSALRSGLVVGQVAVAVILLVGSSLLVRSFISLSRQNPGFATERVLSAEISLAGSQQRSAEQRRAFFDALGERLESLPGVEAVTMANQLPIRNPGNNIGIWDADDPTGAGPRPLAYQRTVRAGYFDALRIPVIAGRAFRPGASADDTLEIVLSQLLARTLFGEDGAVGRRVVPDWGEGAAGLVVGVVEDVRISGLAEGAAPTFYANYASRPAATMNIAVRTRGEPDAIVPELRAVLRAMDPTVPLGDVRTMEDLIADSIGQPRLMSIAVGLFAATALCLSLVGLYGVLAHAVALRQREFGLRIALGATGHDILGIVVRGGMLRIVLGLAIGVPAAIASSRLLEGLLFGVAPLDPISFAAVTVLLVSVGLVACLVPAWRALRLDPVAALRAD